VRTVGNFASAWELYKRCISQDLNVHVWEHAGTMCTCVGTCGNYVYMCGNMRELFVHVWEHSLILGNSGRFLRARGITPGEARRGGGDSKM
jgi:hypothetical protein